jgi:hypothetical protein
LDTASTSVANDLQSAGGDKKQIQAPIMNNVKPATVTAGTSPANATAGHDSSVSVPPSLSTISNTTITNSNTKYTNNTGQPVPPKGQRDNNKRRGGGGGGGGGGSRQSKPIGQTNSGPSSLNNKDNGGGDRLNNLDSVTTKAVNNGPPLVINGST